MTIDFASLLTNEQKRQILEQRIQQFASEAYQLTMNRKTAETINSPEEQIEAIDNSLSVLSAAIDTHKAELDKIPTE